MTIRNGYCREWGFVAGFHDFSDFIMRELCGFLFSWFLHQTVSVLWASILFNSIALLKTIVWDAGESPSPRQGAEASLRWGSLRNTGLNIMRELCGSYAGVMRDAGSTSLLFIMREIMREASNSTSSFFVRRHHGKKWTLCGNCAKPTPQPIPAQDNIYIYMLSHICL